MRIGFIGLGKMGSGMATNLQKAQHKLVINDMNRAAAASYLDAGAEWADSARKVAEQSEIIFTSLPGPPEVEAVALGENGFLPALRKGQVYFDLSTNSPHLMRRIHKIYKEKGVEVFDAPVSGGPAGAASGKLAIWIGGDKATYDKYKHVLDGFSDQPIYCGEIGAGLVVKLVHNMMFMNMMCGMAEVFTMGVKAGVEPVALWESVRQGAMGRNLPFDGLSDYLTDNLDAQSFALKLATKDVRLATELAREVGVPVNISNYVYAEMMSAVNRGMGDIDGRSVMRLQNERAGVPMKVDRKRMAEAHAKATKK